MTEKRVTVEQLIAQGQRDEGSRRAVVDELRRRYLPDVLRHIRARVSDPELAEDIAQQVWLRVFQGLSGFRSDADFSNWLRRITSNAVKTGALRRAALEEQEVTGSVLVPSGEDDGTDWLERALGADPTEGPAEQMVAKEQKEIVRQAVESLPEDYRVAIILFYFRGCSYREVARLLHLAVATVHYRVRQGEKRLKSLLEPYVREEPQAAPRLLQYPIFQGEHPSLDVYKKWSVDEKAHYLESVRQSNAEWLDRAFQDKQAAWLMVLDGKVCASGSSLQSYPSPDRLFALCNQKGKYPFVFVHPAATAVEETGTPWNNTRRTLRTGDRYPTLAVRFVGSSGALPVTADLDTGAPIDFADLDWLQGNGVVQASSYEDLTPHTEHHLGQPYEFYPLPVRIEVVDALGCGHPASRQIVCVRSWRTSPFVSVNKERQALVGRGTLLELGPTLRLDFVRCTTEAYFGNRLVAYIRRMVR